MNFLQSTVYKYFPINKFQDDREFFIFLVSGAACLLAFALHIFWLFFYIYTNVPIFILVNIISISTYSVTLYCIGKRKYGIAGIIITAEVALYTFAANLYFGVESLVFLYFFLILIFQIINPYASNRKRIVISAIVWFMMFTSSLFALANGPLYDNIHPVPLMLLNINVSFGVIIIELLMGNFVKSMMMRLKEVRINELETEANIDPMTGLYNRRFAERYFNDIIGENAEYYVAMLDIDDFKYVNDNYGHDVGDEVLVELAQLLKKNLRKTDTIFRWGGEEILVVINDNNLNSVANVLEKIRIIIEQHEFSSQKIHITVTIGVAELDPFNLRESLTKSDKHLYAGKRSGKNKLVK